MAWGETMAWEEPQLGEKPWLGEKPQLEEKERARGVLRVCSFSQKGLWFWDLGGKGGNIYFPKSTELSGFKAQSFKAPCHSPGSSACPEGEPAKNWPLLRTGARESQLSSVSREY